MEQIPQVQAFVDNLSNQIDDLETNLVPLLSRHLSEQKFESTKEQMQFYTFLAYALDSLIFAYLKTVGEDATKHPIMKELERVKAYMKKVKEYGTEAKDGRSTTVDKQAADRIIKHALAAKDKDGQQNAEEEDDQGGDSKKEGKKRLAGSSQSKPSKKKQKNKGKKNKK